MRVFVARLFGDVGVEALELVLLRGIESIASGDRGIFIDAPSRAR